ncbi:MAG: DUF418 domain-containing protein [candidate division Zixibacteria bacterium]
MNIENNMLSQPVLAPVAAQERIATIDVIRGMAVLGILIINIDFFALPSIIIFNPSLVGNFDGINLLTWEFGYFFFFEKMMAVFSMLFGGGLILMMNRSEKNNLQFKNIYYRRLMWLLIIGLIHAYVFWYGDILFPYAICGMIIYLFRRRSPKFLIILGILMLLIGLIIYSGSGFGIGYVRDQAIQAQAALDAGKEIGPDQQGMLQAWKQMGVMFSPSSETLTKEINAYRGSFSDAFMIRWPMSIMMQTQAFLFMMFWRIFGIMLIGMGLMKSGFLAGDKSNKTYLVWMISGYVIGLPIVAYGMTTAIAHDFDFIRFMMYGAHFNYLASILVAVAHTSLIILLYKKGLFSWLTSRLQAVGRMALSNYLIHTLVFTTIFYGHGFGLFGGIERFWLLLMVLGMWIIQLLYSPLWLRHFRFGPAEWLWRSLTYWKKQPMRM